MSIRTERVAGVIRETITDVLARGGVKDPRVHAGGLITVTHVRVAADLGVAWVSITTVGGEVEQAVIGLRAAAGYLRGEAGKRLHSRRVPELRFQADVAAEQEARVEAAFREIEEERRAAAPPEALEGAAPADDEADADPGAEDADPADADADPGAEDAVPEQTALEDTERVEVPYPASIEPPRSGGTSR